SIALSPTAQRQRSRPSTRHSPRLSWIQKDRAGTKETNRYGKWRRAPLGRIRYRFVDPPSLPSRKMPLDGRQATRARGGQGSKRVAATSAGQWEEPGQTR